MFTIIANGLSDAQTIIIIAFVVVFRSNQTHKQKILALTFGEMSRYLILVFVGPWIEWIKM
jgi:hypothetical protein